jgi:hypothetical protein
LSTKPSDQGGQRPAAQRSSPQINSTKFNAINQYRKLSESKPLTLQGSDYAHAVLELNKAIDTLKDYYCSDPVRPFPTLVTILMPPPGWHTSENGAYSIMKTGFFAALAALALVTTGFSGGWHGNGWHSGYRGGYSRGYYGHRYYHAGYYRWNSGWRWFAGGYNPWFLPIPVPFPYPYYGGYGYGQGYGYGPGYGYGY